MRKSISGARKSVESPQDAPGKIMARLALFSIDK
jgi:hypothetical protein